MRVKVLLGAWLVKEGNFEYFSMMLNDKHSFVSLILSF